MPRWQPNTRERLVQAALELYTEQGYDRTTVGDIANRVGISSRTYFRHFPDKREVLFASGQTLQAAVVAGTVEALAAQPPFAAILAGITASRSVFQSREFVRAREAVIATSEELRERELVKVAAIRAELTTLLTDAGSAPAAARLTASAGVEVLTESIRRWQAGDDSEFARVVQQVVAELRSAVDVGAAMPARTDRA